MNKILIFFITKKYVLFTKKLICLHLIRSVIFFFVIN